MIDSLMKAAIFNDALLLRFYLFTLFSPFLFGLWLESSRRLLEEIKSTKPDIFKNALGEPTISKWLPENTITSAPKLYKIVFGMHSNQLSHLRKRTLLSATYFVSGVASGLAGLYYLNAYAGA